MMEGVARFISTIGFRPPVQPSILIVTEDADGGRAVSTALQAGGYRTRCAPCARLDRMIEAELPDLVVADDGADGIAVCESLKQRNAALPVVVVVPDETARLAAIRAGADHAMLAPLSIEELLARAHWLVDQGARHAALATKLESLRMWQDWVRYFVHDLRSSVTIASGTVSFARHRNKDADVERHLESAERALTDLAMMLRDVLDTDRIKHGVLAPQKEEVDFAELVTSIAKELAPERPIDVSVDGDTTIIADRSLIGRVFSNLMLNATRFARDHVHVELMGTSHGVSARIINDGPGIASEMQSRLFEPWRHIGGDAPSATGIGLAFCRLVCEAHDGTIWLDDGSAGKVTFAFGIPRPRAKGSEGR
jgi:two-component system, sensor histidine kinase and response regulator